MKKLAKSLGVKAKRTLTGFKVVFRSGSVARFSKK